MGLGKGQFSAWKRKGKIKTIQSYLISRATENVVYVLSANSTSQQQWTPTCLIDPDGYVVDIALLNKEYLLTQTFNFKRILGGIKCVMTATHWQLRLRQEFVN